MKVYLAPLQGLTDWVFRESFHEHIGQFDKTFSPFIRVQNGEFYRPGQCNDILPEHNRFQRPVPQFLGNDAESFRRFEESCLEHQYTGVNINMGCPFVKVVNKGMGAGMLSHPERVAGFLKTVFASTKLDISIKCRLGQENAAEFEQLIPILNEYPVREIILHPRVAKQMYKGEVDLDAFARYAPLLKHPVCYNGDIETVIDIRRIQKIFPVSAIMIGRGILRHPFLLAEIKNQELTHAEKVNRMRSFHLSLVERSREKYAGDMNLLRRLEEMWEYHCEAFQEGRKILKQVKKCNTVAKYETVLSKALDNLI